MSAHAKPFTLFATLRGGLVETYDCDSIADAEHRFDELAGAGEADRGEVYAGDRFDVPVRVLRVRR